MEGNEELSGNSGETEATVAKHMTRRTFVAAACGAVAAAACGPVTVTMLGCAKQNADDSAWTWEEDADLPVLCMEVSGGAIVAMPGNGWKPQDEWIQLQLSGGSIPGKEIEAITQEGSTLVVRLKKPNSDMETMDLCFTEYRVAGGNVSSVESVVVEDKGERLEAQLGVDGEARAVQQEKRYAPLSSLTLFVLRVKRAVVAKRAAAARFHLCRYGIFANRRL